MNENEIFDIIIIGGGIIGTGIARDAALRGLKIALIEKEDYGYGTSSRSTRLIHGGLRYLEMLDFPLVRQDLREREILLHLAPHRVKPLPFLLPFYLRSPLYRLKVRVGMALYDLLSFDKSLPNHRMLTREETLTLEPNLNTQGLQGAMLYYDAQIALPERLCLENILDAQRNDAKTFNHTQVESLLQDENRRICGVQAHNKITNETFNLHSKIVLNATGAWLNGQAGTWSEAPKKRLRLTKGIHFTSPKACNHALVLFAKADNRLMFVIPWLEYAWVGTTDTDFDADLDTVHATAEEVQYLQETAKEALPQGDWNTIHFTQAGVRALVRDNRPDASESAVSRKHGLVRHTSAEGLEGLLSVLGGKLTAYRDIAREAVDTSLSILSPNEKKPHSLTHIAPLPGAETPDWKQFCTTFKQNPLKHPLTQQQLEHLLTLYGTRAPRLLEQCQEAPELFSQIHPTYPDIKGQIRFAIEEEQAQTVSDLFLRRTRLGFTPDQGLNALESIIDTMGTLLQWEPERRAKERNTYLAQIALTQKFRTPS